MRIFCAVICACLWTGCEGGDDDDSADTGAADAAAAAGDDAAGAATEDVASDPNVSGVWTGNRSSAGGSSSITLNFTQSELSHMWSLGGSYSDTSGFAGIITGGLSKGTRTVSFDVILMEGGVPTGNSFDFIGEVSADGNTISGTYEYGATSGNWTVSR